MDTNQHTKTEEKTVEKRCNGEGKSKQEVKEEQVAKQHLTTSPASPPSASSSPSHEFSFTISLHSSASAAPDKSKGPPSFAIDLSPADDIFFHGHLLPLHLLSHLPVSPRSSTNSLDSFSLPIRELIDEQKSDKTNRNCSTSSDSINNSIPNNNKDKSSHTHHKSNSMETKGRRKAKSFSLFGGLTRRQKGREAGEGEEDKQKQKKRMRFDVSHVIRRYVRMVRPLLFFRGRREHLRLHRQTYSFSGNLNWSKKELRERGEYSAPASMRTSPTNSGLLVATPTLASSASDSTMEELQAAIQAAIAHCKKSIGLEEKIRS